MPLEVHHALSDFRSACDRVRASGGKLGFVPTMGALHRGHLALVEAARERSQAVAVSIFVNPTQFGPNEDLARYPRNLERDVELLRGVGADLVFAPAASTMYPGNERTRVQVSGLTAHLCGPKRPGHFEGVATIVTKLFAAAGPCVAVFGRKDYQQLKVVERLAADLLLPVEVVGHPTLRDADGLALSSRNAYLSPEERGRALAIPRALSRAVARFGRGERGVTALVEAARTEIEAASDRVDYVTLAHPDELEPLAPCSVAGPRALLAVAAFVGSTRLIDNVVLGEDLPPIPELE